MLTIEQNRQFSDILEELGKSLDITKEQHDSAVKSYEFVGNWLAAADSPLAKYKPEILPQGSFMLNTMIKPVKEGDELDIDLVCRLEGKEPHWTQKDVKCIVGDRLKDHGTIRPLVVIPDGRRCWRLEYAEDTKFHMDILPSVTSSKYKVLLQQAFSERDIKDFESLAIRITDKKANNYITEQNHIVWLKSNPFGYGIWFEQRASIAFERAVLMSESVRPVPNFQRKKYPLHRIVQILKRHRDIMFNGDENKPISIIITTLAAMAYAKQTDIFTGLLSVIDAIPGLIKERYSQQHNKMIKWIPNPVNPEENFADKWAENPIKERNFYKWIEQVKIDIRQITLQHGIHLIQEAFTKPFGETSVQKAFGNYAGNMRFAREEGKTYMSKLTGTLGSRGASKVPNHNFHGAD